MNSVMINGARMLGAGLALLIASGCATKGYVDERVRAAQSAAERAQAAASAASAKADKAAADAVAAKQAADRAEQCCADTNEKIDRMFQRSMQK